MFARGGTSLGYSLCVWCVYRYVELLYSYRERSGAIHGVVRGVEQCCKSCSNSPPQLDAGVVGVELDVQDGVLVVRRVDLVAKCAAEI